MIGKGLAFKINVKTRNSARPPKILGACLTNWTCIDFPSFHSHFKRHIINNAVKTHGIRWSSTFPHSIVHVDCQMFEEPSAFSVNWLNVFSTFPQANSNIRSFTRRNQCFISTIPHKDMYKHGQNCMASGGFPHFHRHSNNWTSKISRLDGTSTCTLQNFQICS